LRRIADDEVERRRAAQRLRRAAGVEALEQNAPAPIAHFGPRIVAEREDQRLIRGERLGRRRGGGPNGRRGAPGGRRLGRVRGRRQLRPVGVAARTPMPQPLAMPGRAATSEPWLPRRRPWASQARRQAWLELQTVPRARPAPAQRRTRADWAVPFRRFPASAWS